MTDIPIDIQYRLGVGYLYKISQLLLNNNIKHWLDCGTLLHGYRNKAINSADVVPKGISSSDNKLNDVDFDISFLYKDYNTVKDVFNNSNIPYTVEREDCVLRINHTMQWNNMWTDFYFHRDIPGTKKLINDIFSGLTSKYFIEELDEIKLYAWKFPVPRYTEQFLQSRYGDTWSTPMTKKYYEKNMWNINKTLFQPDKVTVYIDGVWDLFHRGHVELFKRAHNMYDKVVVGVCSDEVVTSYKRNPIIPYEDRVEVLKSCTYVDEVYIDAPHTPSLEFLDKNKFDYLLHAVEDSINWKFEITNLYHEDVVEIINADRFHYLSYTGYHSTDIINNIVKQYS
jgi:cytidyltransferase-like protein